MNKLYQKNIPVIKPYVTRRLGGFTLIELLVVVLIIGILTPVAVPQYQKAVEKARAVEALSTIKKIKQNLNIQYLANGALSISDETTWDGLDYLKPTASGIIKQGEHYCYAVSLLIMSYPGECQASYSSLGLDDYYFKSMLRGAWGDGQDIMCVGKNTKGKAFCKNFGEH